jgi:uncharacterized membrane protein YdfJ with MMPL/SSD domain/dienelactone hydrolase
MKSRVMQDDLPDPAPPAAAPDAAKATNLAGRMGRWSSEHRKTAIFGWLAFAIGALAIGTLLGTKTIDVDKAGSGESGRAGVILADNFKQPPSEDVLVQSATLVTADRPFRAAIEDVVRRLRSQPEVQNIRSPLATGNTGQLAADGHSALVTFKLKTTEKKQAKLDIVPVEETIAAAQAAHPALTIAEFGGASANKALDEAVGKDFKKAGLFSLPVTLIVLIVAFGALVAAGLPLLLGITAVFATLGLLAIPSRLLPMDADIAVIVLLIGLAVGVDYAMFYLKRERQERAAGLSERAALEAAAASSGRAVLISGLSMMVAMAGMFLTRDKTFMSFALATMLVVGVAVLGSLTVLPAVLSALGDKVDKLRVPYLHRLRRDDGEGRFWNAILTPVLAHPAIAAVASAGALVALAIPALQLHTTVPGPETFPKSLPVMRTYAKIQKVFPGGEIPANVVIKAANVRSPQVQEAIGQLEWRALASGQMHDPITVDVNKAGTVAVVNIPVDGEGTDAASEAALATLRGTIIPDTVGALEGAEVAVAGETAGSKDFNDQMKSAAPFVFVFVLAFAFVLLLVSFRSIVIPIKAILLNLLSVAAAYGALVLIFQHGWGKGLLDFDYTGGVVAFLPVFLFVILFGLSMDYHVFVLSRVREAYDGGMSTEDAVAHGIKSTAAVVTSAAIVMVGVFSIFGTLSLLFLKQFGIGLAIAVLLDATIVRAILLPATMKLLGDWNWYLPSWLECCRTSTTVEARPPSASSFLRRSSLRSSSVAAISAAAPTTSARVREIARIEQALVVVGAGLVALHLADDNFLQPQPGTSAADHLASGLVPIAVLVVAGIAYSRLRAGWRGAIAITLGLFGIAVGASEAGYYSLQVGPSGDDYTGLIAIPAGLLLVGVGATTLWRTRRLDDSRAWRYLRRALLTAAALSGGWIVLGPLTFAYLFTHVARIAVPEARLGTGYQNVSFTTSDGLRLRGWYVPSRNGAAVIAFPGRKGPQRQARMLARHGYGVLLFDRRGEGASDGDPLIFGWTGVRDLHAAVAFLQHRPDVERSRIGGIGLSVGGEMLLQAAAESDDFEAVVSDGAGARSIRENRSIPGKNAWLALPQSLVITAATAVFANHLPPPNLKDLVGRIAPRPLLLIYAEHGETSEVALSPIFYAAAGEPKTIWKIPGASHTHGIETRPREYERRVVSVFDRALLGRAARRSALATEWSAAS